MKKYLAAIVMVVAFSSCEKVENPTAVETKLFNIQIVSDFLETSESGWLMLHDMKGDPFDFKPFSNGMQVQFEVEKNELYHMTILKKISAGSFDRYNVETIAAVNTEKEFVLGLKKPSRSNPLDPNGEFEVMVSAQQHLNSTVISSSTGHVSGISNFGGFQSMAKMSLSQNSQNYLASTRSDSDEIRYSFISQPQNGQKVNLTFSQMMSFDKVLKIPYYQVGSLIYSVKVLEKVNGNWKDSFWLNTNIHEAEPAIEDYHIGYLNQFENYETAIMATVSSQVTAGLVKVGKAPTSLQLPLNKSITMSSQTLSNAAFSSDMTFNNWSGNWRLRDQSGNLAVIWDVWGKDSGFKLKGFATEFTANHPQFSNLDSFQLFSMKLMQSHKEYQNLVESRFVEINNLEESQEYYLNRRF